MSLALDMNGCTGHGNYPVSNFASGRIAAAGLEISVDAHRVKANGIHVLLRPAEFRLLLFFMTHAERVHSRDQLLAQAWKRKVLVGERTVDVHIRRLRAALEPFGLEGLIQTVHGSGYRFSAIRCKPESSAEPAPLVHAVLRNAAARTLSAIRE